jgi:hypothetical protein
MLHQQYTPYDLSKDATGRLGGRDWTVMGVGLLIGIPVGIFTARHLLSSVQYSHL